ncbi:MAG: hypothetical protein RBU37_01030 [Myxococcota bacterium]|jgi:hypothetical protein|nr:hypothetical protein [Myxococcota bacterium]
MRFVKALAMFLVLAFATTTVVGCKKEEAPAKKEAKKDDGKKDEAKPDEAKPDEANPEEAKTDEAKTDEAKPEEAPAADGAAFGEKCQAYIAEVEKNCKEPANDVVKAACEGLNMTVDGFKQSLAAGPEAVAALEMSCEAAMPSIAAALSVAAAPTAPTEEPAPAPETP